MRRNAGTAHSELASAQAMWTKGPWRRSERDDACGGGVALAASGWEAPRTSFPTESPAERDAMMAAIFVRPVRMERYRVSGVPDRMTRISGMPAGRGGVMCLDARRKARLGGRGPHLSPRHLG